MSLLLSSRSLIENDLEMVDQFMVEALSSNIPLIQDMVRYILSAGGKRIRPIITLLSANALNYAGNETVQLASIIELIHTATLLHDDVVDGTTLRRGHETANHIWNNKSSILVGDFLYSRAFQLVVNLKNDDILDQFAEATHYIAEGEILQLSNCYNPDTTETFYFDIISRKTAKLFELAALLPTLLKTETKFYQAALSTFGLNIGIAYQLVDDALDYMGKETEIGKNIYQDLSEGKATLPLIYAIQHSNGAEKKVLQDAIQTGSSDKTMEIQRIIESKNATGYTLQAANHHAEIAKNAISILPNSPYRQGLEDICNFIVARSY